MSARPARAKLPRYGEGGDEPPTSGAGPTRGVVALFATIATWAVARYAFRGRGD